VTSLGASDGVSIVEVLVALALMLALAGIAMTASTVAARNEQGVGRRADALDTAMSGMSRMTREIRGARTVTLTSPWVLDLVTMTSKGASNFAYASVRYDCSSTTDCIRTQAGAQTAKLATGLVNTAGPFSATCKAAAVAQGTKTPNLNYVAIKLRIRVDGRTSGAVDPAYGPREAVELNAGVDVPSSPTDPFSPCGG
jgi:hypothetical protein